MQGANLIKVLGKYSNFSFDFILPNGTVFGKPNVLGIDAGVRCEEQLINSSVIKFVPEND